MLAAARMLLHSDRASKELDSNGMARRPKRDGDRDRDRDTERKKERKKGQQDIAAGGSRPWRAVEDNANTGQDSPGGSPRGGAV